MKFNTEICKGVSCPECSFNEGEDGCLLAKRLDEIEITTEPCEDVVPRTSVEYICRKNTVSTNPYEHKYHDKFIQFMDDPEISDFGRWQHSNGFNTALVAVKCDLDKVPSAQPEKQHGRIFQGIIVEYPTISTYPGYEGKPYFSIKYTENGQEFIGYGTYKPEVLSEYLKEYFIPSAQPEQIAQDIATIIENEKDMRVILNAPSAQSEIIRCKDCMHNGSYDTDCPIDWNGKEYCSFAERKEDE